MTTAPSNQFNAAAESEAGYGQLLAVLVRRWRWFAGIFAIAMTISAVAALRQQPTFVSSMQLLVEPNYKTKQDDKSLGKEFTDTNVEADNATQINLMQSSDLMRRAMEILQPTYPDFDPRDRTSLESFKSMISVTQLLAKGAGQKATIPTKIFIVSYTDTDPVKAQDVVKALQKVYLDYNLEQQQTRLAKGLNFITRQLPEMEGKVKDSESQLERFRKSQSVINPETQAQAQETRLNRIQQEQETSLSEIKSLQSRFNSLQKQLSMSPEEALSASRLSQSTRYQGVLGEIQKTELALVQQRLRFKDSTPYVQQLLDQRQQQLGLLQAEAQRVFGSGTSTGGGREGQLSQGQLSTTDVSLVNEFITTYTNLQAGVARYNSLLNVEQQARQELKRYPRLLAEFGKLQPQVELDRQTLKQLLTAQQELGLEIAKGGFDWQVVEAPQVGSRMSSGRVRTLLLGAVVGLFLAGIAAFIREAIDDSLHSLDDLKKQSMVPLLGTVPEMLPIQDDGGLPIDLMSWRSPAAQIPADQVLCWQPFREAMDLLYQNMQLLGNDSPLRSLVVTSALVGEGKSTLTLGLAISAARLHQRVLVIDADLRRPSLHKLLNLPNTQGLSTLLTNEQPLPTRLDTQPSYIRNNIAVLTSGPIPADPAKLLSSQRMQDVIAAFEQNYDLVLIDVPPILGMVDATLAASRSTGVVIVGRLGQVKRAEFAKAIATLEKLNLIGVVANGVAYSSSNIAVYQPQTT